MFDHDQTRVHVSPKVVLLYWAKTHRSIEIAGSIIIRMTFRGRNCFYLDIFDSAMMQNLLSLFDQRPTNPSTMKFLSHTHHVDFRGMSVMPVNGKEPYNTSFNISHESFHVIQVAPILNDRFLDSEPIWQGPQNGLAEIGFVGRHLPDLDAHGFVRMTHTRMSS
jgi:hypothetical protein